MQAQCTPGEEPAVQVKSSLCEPAGVQVLASFCPAAVTKLPVTITEA